MSNPLDRDYAPEEPSAYAPKRVREARRNDRSLRFGPERIEDFTETAADAAARYRVPRSLDPTLVPEPCWQDGRSRWGTGLVIRLAGASALAALVALFVVGKLPTSWMSSATSKAGEALPLAAANIGRAAEAAPQPKPADKPSAALAQLIIGTNPPQLQGQSLPLNIALTAAAPGGMVIIDGLAPGATLNVGRASRARGWRLMAADLADALVRPPQDFVGAMELAIELRLADDSVADHKTLHLEWTAPPPPAPKPTPAIAQAPAVPQQPAAPPVVLRQLDPQEVAALVRRGEETIAAGDLASARLLLQRAAESGDVRAALALAGTYDPNVLAKLGVQGLVADIGLARLWYQRAREFGSAEAPRRLEQLARVGSP